MSERFELSIRALRDAQIGAPIDNPEPVYDYDIAIRFLRAGQKVEKGPGVPWFLDEWGKIIKEKHGTLGYAIWKEIRAMYDALPDGE